VIDTLNHCRLPRLLEDARGALADEQRREQRIDRLWERDSSLWTSSGEELWLGWLDIAERQLASPTALRALREDVSAAGFRDVLLLGMGGSSLCPEVFARTFGPQKGFPQLHVLDSTVPAQVRVLEAAVDLRQTLFFVSSKSGSTLEPDILRRYFFDRAGEALGRHPGDRFIAVTDPGSKLEETAALDRYRHIFYGLPEIGGRFSALSNFGMAPAAAMGLDVEDFLQRAQTMVEACRRPDPEQNPGVALGLLLGASARAGRDKLTIWTSESVRSLGAWLEQLIAESTGKHGKAVIPVDLEPVGRVDSYGADRLFVLIRVEGENDFEKDAEAIEAAGLPLIRITLGSRSHLGQELFRWEIATAVAGQALEINPFDQPDVEASKTASRKLMNAYEDEGKLPLEIPFFEDETFGLFADSSYAVSLGRSFAGEESLDSYLAAHLARISAGDYLALLAYIEMSEGNQSALAKARRRLRDKLGAATCLGFGPRFLHSTGQAYKGGPSSGVFLQVTADDAFDLAVPGKSYGFSAVKAAQARGDFEVLTERRRRALRIHLKGDVSTGLGELLRAIETYSP